MRMSPGSRVAALATVVLATPLILAGCAPLSGFSGSGPRVVGSFYPLAYVAQRITGDHADVVDLTSPGVEPHDLELTVRQTADVADADVMVYEKGMQPAVDATVSQNPPRRVVQVTQVVRMRPLAPGELVDTSGSQGAPGRLDMHFWLDPLRMVGLARAVETRMSQVDPRHEHAYAANLRAFTRDMRRLDAAYRRGLAHCRIHTVVVSHDAFRYLGRYGLHFEPIAGLTPEAEPSAAHLTQIGNLIRSDHITTVFTETLASPALADTLARDLHVKTAVLDPIEGLSRATAGQDYLSLLRSNHDELRSANQCR